MFTIGTCARKTVLAGQPEKRGAEASEDTGDVYALGLGFVLWGLNA